MQNKKNDNQTMETPNMIEEIFLFWKMNFWAHIEMKMNTLIALSDQVSILCFQEVTTIMNQDSDISLSQEKNLCRHVRKS